MDNFHSLFSLQQDDNNDHQQLIYPPTNYTTNSSFLNYHEDTTFQLQDLVTDLAPFGNSLLEVDTNNNFDSNKTNNIINKKRGKNKLQKSSSADSLQVEKGTSVDDNQKKIMHKEIERQRRQEMSNLCASLRELLPFEYLKGKRSTSDHILEAVSYIEYLQKKIRDLEDKRDKLKRDLSSSDVDYPRSGFLSTSESSRTIVKMRPCLDGMEILINWSLTNKGFCLSKVLEVLLQEGLSIVNCSCNKVNGRLLHSIQTEVCSPASIDAYELQQKLAATIQTDESLLD